MKIAVYILSFCFMVVLLVKNNDSYQAGLREGELRARTEAVVILRQIDRSGIICQKYIQSILNKYGVKSKLKIKGGD